jgi:hypothetical protein
MSRWLRDQRGFWTLIELVIVAALIMIAMYLWISADSGGLGGGAPAGYVPRRGGPTTRPGIALDMAVSVQCMENLRAIRQSLQLARDQDDSYPQSLQELRLPPSSLRCPNTGTDYLYDPATGRVKCLTPGHGKY